MVKAFKCLRYNWSERFREGGVAALVASRGSGKSTLLRQVLYEIKDRFEVCIAFCGSSDAARSMSRLCHPAFLYTCLDPEELTDRLEAICDEQERLASLRKHKNMCIILEDVADDRKFMRSNPALKRIASRGRHAAITLVCTVQYSNQLPPDVRANIDTLAIMFCKGAERENIRRSFFSMTSSKEFNNIVDCVCTNYRSLVLDATRQSPNLSDQLFFTKASLNIPDFTLLSPTYKAIADSIVMTANDVYKAEESLRQQRKAQREQRSMKRLGVKLSDTLVALEGDDHLLVTPVQTCK